MIKQEAPELYQKLTAPKQQVQTKQMQKPDKKSKSKINNSKV